MSRRATVGREVTSGLYYEILGSPERLVAPILFIHGGGGSGTTFRATPDGRLGWSDLLAERGYRSWVTDWPGTGRSGYRDLVTLDYADVVGGYISLLRDVIGEPVVVVPHSMGGAVAWKLVEMLPHLVAGVVSLAAVHPANLDTPCELLSDEDGVVKVRFTQTGVDFTVDSRIPYTYESSYVYDQGVANSAQFPREAIPNLFAGHQGMSPRMLLQRVGLRPGMPVVDDPAGFAGKRVRLMAGDRDPAHPRDIELRTVAQLRAWGADADLTWLPDHGFDGNGHYLMGEANSDAVLELFIKQLHTVTEGTSK
ncbi:MAG TPA: alpha/beta fold hydrolase [Candidatus Lustribacter sp.]